MSDQRTRDRARARAWHAANRALGLCQVCRQRSGQMWKCLRCRLRDVAIRRARREAQP